MNNITPLQRELLERVQARLGALQIRWHEGRGTAAVLGGPLLEAGRIGADPAEAPGTVLARFLEEYGPLIGPENVRDACRLVGMTPSARGHVRIRAMQTAEGLPIHGGTLLLFVDPKRGLFRVQSGFHREVQVPPLVYRGKPVDPKQRAVALRQRLDTDLRNTPEGKRFAERKLAEGFGNDEEARSHFPLTAAPVHWLLPTPEGLRHVFRLHAYQPLEWLGVNGELRKAIDLADLTVDLLSGRTLSQGARLGAWTDVAADGLSTLQEGGSYVTRALQAVREDAADRLLVNRNTTPSIITHDAGGSETGLDTKFKNDTHISRDADGHWNATTTSCTAADRRDAQQPETDGHFFAGQAFQFYDQLGWTGFDNGEWGAAPCVVRVAAHIGLDANAYFWRYIQNGRHYGYVAFYDGDGSGTNLKYDFMAGDPAIYAHEYQHGVTYFGSVDSAGNPGYLETSDWHRAIHEGLSDAVAGLRTGTWIAPGTWPAGACRSGKPFRRIEYPRSTDTKNSLSYRDHYDDRAADGDSYTNSTILSHAIYLAGQGGVHERTTRDAVLIPVCSAGQAEVARVVHHAVTEFFDNISPNTDGSKTMIEAANLILDAAEELAGNKRSCAYVMLRRAFYAVGLFPYDEAFARRTYGGEACMLPWTIAWEHSRPYLGFPALWYQSPDLFIHNGTAAGYDAVVGVENLLFARVRNIGDQDLTHVVVRFYFRAHGTNLPASSTQWKPCRDSTGADCVLTIPTLAAGSMNFTDENNPPASQAQKWFLDGSEVVAGVDHFCLRAEITCAAPNHDHDCPNYVQSNVSHSQPAGAGLDFGFFVANRGQKPIPLDLQVDLGALPDDIQVRYLGVGSLREIRLAPGQEIPLRWQVVLPPSGLHWRKPPYDGPVTGRVRGAGLEGRLEAVLSNAVLGKRSPTLGRDEVALEGLLAGRVLRVGGRRDLELGGLFQGVLNRRNGQLKGTWATAPDRGVPALAKGAKLAVEGTLRPTRAVHFTQRVDGRPVGGITYALRWP